MRKTIGKQSAAPHFADTGCNRRRSGLRKWCFGIGRLGPTLVLLVLCASALSLAQRAGAFAGVVDAGVRLSAPSKQGEPECNPAPVRPEEILAILGRGADTHIGRRIVSPDTDSLPPEHATSLSRLAQVGTGTASCATLCVMGLNAPSLEAEACMREPAGGRQQCRKSNGGYDRIGAASVVAFSRTGTGGKGVLVCATGRNWREGANRDFSLSVRW